jgi:methylenetetrahydrofolate dehydrogenase (NADP+) / methenyltetrahydrofolate cyclohydrolase
MLAVGKVLDGKALAEETLHKLKVEIEGLNRQPTLHVLVSKHDPASVSYVKMKCKAANKIGAKLREFLIDDDHSQEDMENLIKSLNENSAVDGILVQHPLPSHLSEQKILALLDPKKDVDGISPLSLGALASRMPGHRAATPLGIMRLLKHYDIEISGKNALVIGESQILGRPMALMLLNAGATVSIAHKQTRDLEGHVGRAEILVSATGVANLVKAHWVRGGTAVVDCGYASADGQVCGDVECIVKEKASYTTPVPGGVGPMTVATLMSNLVDATRFLGAA